VVACQHLVGAAGVGATVYDDWFIGAVDLQGLGNSFNVAHAWVLVVYFQVFNLVLLRGANVGRHGLFLTVKRSDGISIAPCTSRPVAASGALVGCLCAD